MQVIRATDEEFRAADHSGWVLDRFSFIEAQNTERGLERGDEVFTYVPEAAPDAGEIVVVVDRRHTTYDRPFAEMIRDSLFGYFTGAPGGAYANSLR